MAFELLQLCDGHPECRQNHDVVGPEAIDRSGIVAQKTDAHRSQLFVDVRVVDDFAGQMDGAIRKPLARLVRIVDRAVDAVAEAELTGEMDRQPPGAKREVVRLDAIDDYAVVVLGQHAGDGILQVETFAEDEGWHRQRRGSRE